MNLFHRIFCLLMVSPVSSVLYDPVNFTALPQDDFSNTTSNGTVIADVEAAESGILLNYVILPLGIIIFFLVLIGLSVFLIRKKRLDKLRHHLMPLYSFDPAEEGEDWEAELLEDGTDHTPHGKNCRPSDQPQLSFRGNL